MTPYCLATGDVKKRHLALLDQVRAQVAAMPDGLTCHEVCERVARKVPSLRPRRGWFVMKGFEHSWLELPGEEVIIDPYPWACASGPILVTTEGLLNPWRLAYIEAPAAADLESAARVRETELVDTCGT